MATRVVKTLCSRCFDNFCAGQNFGAAPQSICENCGRECLGYVGQVDEIDWPKKYSEA